MPVHLHEREGDVLQRGEMRKQIVGLEHGADAPAMRDERLVVLEVDLLAVENHPAAADVGKIEPRQDAQQRGFAAARRADQHQPLHLGQIDRDVLQHAMRAE